jgi:hypothetical protein
MKLTQLLETVERIFFETTVGCLQWYMSDCVTITNLS